MAKDIGIDLGTANVLIWIKGQGIVLNEPSIVAMEKETKKIIAVGKEANQMFGRTPGTVQAIKPMKDGVIADFEVTQMMLNIFIKKIKARSLFTRPRILICCPTNITPVEKNAIKEAAERTGARAVYIEEEPKVAAIGAGMDISKPEANMVIDIGGGTTDIAVLSLNDMVTSESIRIAGNVLDQDIIKYIKNKYKLLIGEKTAENLKINNSNVFDPDKKQKVEIKGRNLITGLPCTEEINQVELEEAMHESLFKIIKAATNVLEQTPPELSADIASKGLVLTGGVAMLEGITELFSRELNVPVLIADSPLTCVVEGTGVLLENIKRLESSQN